MLDVYEFRTTPFQHQLQEFDQHHQDIARAIFWEQGTGKTKLIIDSAAWLWLQGKIDGLLIVAPNGVHQNWTERELERHMPEGVRHQSRIFTFHSSRARTSSVQATMKTFPGSPGFAILAMSYEGYMTEMGRKLARKFLTTRRVMFVLDEARRIKSPTAKRTRAIVADGELATYRRILTGTPVANGPFDVYAPIKFLDAHFWQRHGFGSFLAFKTTFGIWQDMRLGHRRFQYLVAFRHLERLSELLRPISSRVTKDEVLDLPPKLYSIRTFEMTRDQARHYENLRDDFFTTLGDSADLLTAPLAITRTLRLRQVLSGYLPTDESSDCRPLPGGNARLAALADLCEEIPHQAIIWASFQRDVDLICELLGSEAVRYDGKVGERGRSAAIDMFQSGKARWFVGNPQAGGTGLTLHAARTVVYYNSDWDLEKRLQSEDRAHRIGQEHPVSYVDLVCEGTIDEEIAAALQRKESISAKILMKGACLPAAPGAS